MPSKSKTFSNRLTGSYSAIAAHRDEQNSKVNHSLHVLLTI